MASKTIGVGIIGLGMGRNALGINADRNSGLAVRAICDVEEGTVARVASESDRDAFDLFDLLHCVGVYRARRAVPAVGRSGVSRSRVREAAVTVARGSLGIGVFSRPQR